MPPKIPIRASHLNFRNAQSSRSANRTLPFHLRRCFADKPWADKPAAERPLENDPKLEDEPKGPNMGQLPHVSEEAAATNKIMGTAGPQVEEQGTPVAEVAKGDDVEKHLPKVMKEQMKRDAADTQTSGTKGSRPYSTLARQGLRATWQSPPPSSSRPFSTISRLRLEVQHHGSAGGVSQSMPPPALTPRDHAQAAVEEEFDEDELDEEYEDGYEEDLELDGSDGLKFGPVAPLSGQSHLRKRYDPLVEQVTKLMMRDGKLAAAQNNMSVVMTHLATAPAPRLSQTHKLLLQGATSADLPLNPALYLSVAIDSVAPLFCIRNQKGAAGGGVALQIPIPLRLRQRRRQAVVWILDAVAKRKDGVSGFPKRFAEELVSIVEGRSSAWEKRQALNGQGIRARVNVRVPRRF